MSENKTENKNMPFLSIKDLKVEYMSDGQAVHAVNGVSLTLERGKTLGLVGETGAGKTTIAKSILRILPDIGCHIRQGEICLDGDNVLTLPEHDMRKIRGNKVSMIFQDPMTALNPVQRVGEQIAEVVQLHSDGKTDSEARAKEMLEIVGIPAERYYEYPHQFSGGMKQRVVIAIALACNPKLLIADEPTTALDVTIQAQVLDLMKELKHKFNTSIVLITHDFGIVAELCEKVAVMYAGEIVESGLIEQIFANKSHPYTVGLFGAIPTIEKDVERLETIPGMPANSADLPAGCKFHPRCRHCADICRKQAPKETFIEPGHMVRCHLFQKRGGV